MKWKTIEPEVQRTRLSLEIADLIEIWVYEVKRKDDGKFEWWFEFNDFNTGLCINAAQLESKDEDGAKNEALEKVLAAMQAAGSALMVAMVPIDPSLEAGSDVPADPDAK